MKEDEKSAIKSSIIEKWKQLKVIVITQKMGFSALCKLRS